MEQKIQLSHPEGKRAISMNREKYDSIKNILLNSLKNKGELTQKEMVLIISEDFKKRNINFEGSVEWNLEWVKLDLEAKKEIKRLNSVSPIKYGMV
jgi:hypothetical protein